MSGQPSAPADLEEFIRRCEDGLRHQVRGDSEPLLELWSHAEDIAILGAIGSYASGWAEVQAHLRAAAKTLDWTRVAVQPITRFVTDGLALSVTLERMTREANGAPETRTLRVTHGYRRERGAWRLVLRHANGVSDEDAEREEAILRDAGLSRAGIRSR